jgi:uncharacterized membrane protein YgcG
MQAGVHAAMTWATSECTACAAGRFALPGEGGEQGCPGRCPAGRFGAGASASSRCTGACGAGTFGTTRGLTSPLCSGFCAAGRFSREGAVACTACPEGRAVSQPGAGACAKCGPGRFASYDYLGATHCLKCPEGKHGLAGYGPKAVGSTGCEEDAPTPAPTPSPTPPTPAPTASPTLAPTPAPTAAPTPLCAAGRYARAAVAWKKQPRECILCPEGKFTARAHSGACLPCAAGRYGQRGDASSACSGACPPGRFGSGGSGSARCSGPCAAGRYGMGGSVGGSCAGPCPPGRWAGRGSAGCAQCPAGRFGAGASQTRDCGGECRAGRYGAAGAVSVSGGCTGPCRAGHLGTAGAVTAHCGGECQPGRFADAAAGSSGACEFCGPGRWSEAWAASECKACPSGRYSPRGSVDAAGGSHPFLTELAHERTGRKIGTAQVERMFCHLCPAGKWTNGTVAARACGRAPRTRRPTPSPTAQPSPSPTLAPTPSPTGWPTHAPTPAPTLAPTPAPPTPAPTPAPTAAPTPTPYVCHRIQLLAPLCHQEAAVIESGAQAAGWCGAVLAGRGIFNLRWNASAQELIVGRFGVARELVRKQAWPWPTNMPWRPGTQRPTYASKRRSATDDRSAQYFVFFDAAFGQWAVGKHLDQPPYLIAVGAPKAYAPNAIEEKQRWTVTAGSAGAGLGARGTVRLQLKCLDGWDEGELHASTQRRADYAAAEGAVTARGAGKGVRDGSWLGAEAGGGGGSGGSGGSGRSGGGGGGANGTAGGGGEGAGWTPGPTPWHLPQV